MDNFRTAFKKKTIETRLNNFGLENYDEFRFGKNAEITEERSGLLEKTKKVVKKITGYHKGVYKDIAEKALDNFKEYETGLEFLYKNLSPADRDLLVDIIAYRAFGHTKIKLPRNNKAYHEAIKTAKKLRYSNETYDPHFMHLILERFNLKAIGYDIDFFFSDAGIATDFIVEQYAYKRGKDTLVEAEAGDVVLDIGGCWGDTALYFAQKVGENGKVFSFEFIPDNIKLHNINTGLNPHFKNRLELVPHPVTNTSGNTIYFKDNGPGSRIETHPFEGQTGTTTTVTIDDFVATKALQRIDFIKMDIEGAEPLALAGAIKTIKKFKPKLAISIYHSMDDLVNIPKWIQDLDPIYELFIGHYTIHGEETVCFAKPRYK